MRNRLVFFIISFLFSWGFSQDLDIKFYGEQSGDSYSIYADNDEFAPVSSQFVWTLTNMNCSEKDNENVVIPARTKKYKVATLSVIDKYKKFSFRYNNQYSWGDANKTSYDKDYIYTLPFEIGKTQQIYQGYNGKFSHQDKNCLDFNLKIDDKIYAAREGIVVETVEEYNQSCASETCSKFGNRIIIMHSDGTFAEYVHLKQNGVEINEGDAIEKGQFLGYSGNTGWSNGPHLHFSVFQIQRKGNRVYLATQFRTEKSERETLVEKQFYKRIN